MPQKQLVLFTNTPQSKLISIFLWILSILLCMTGCYPVPISPPATLINTTPSLASVTPESTITPIPTPTILSLPAELVFLKIDGVKTNAEMDPRLNTWVWQNKKKEIRRLLDPLTNHLLSRTSVAFDRLTFDIDQTFKWEVNLVNYVNYGAHAPFGSDYIQLLKFKYPQSFSQADENTGIVFRIIQGSLQDIPDSSRVSYSTDIGTEKECNFLRPVFIPETNEYLFYLLMRTDYLTKKGAINTYTDWMLNYSLNSEYPDNPSGSWGIELYKHPIK